jgi:hypothetical protein
MHTRQCFVAPGFVLALFAGGVAGAGLTAAQMTPGPGAAVPDTSQSLAPRPPAATLSRPTSATKAPDMEGFLRRWLVLEPIRTNGQLSDSAIRSLVGTTHFPDQFTTLPRHGDTVTVGENRLSWHAVDTSRYNVNLYHFAYALNKPTSNVLFWAVTVVHVPREMANVRLAIGSNAASVWWVNGEEVITQFNDRQAVIDDGVSNRLTLKAGANVIRAAIINAGGATDFCARLLDANDRPITSVTVALPTSAN